MYRLCAAFFAILSTVSAADLPREKQMIEGKELPVSAKSDITIAARTDSDVRNRELWYRRFDGSWQTWQKHGLTFARETPITWAPPEAHWQIYVRIEEVSGLKMPEPGAETTSSYEFIIDRTAPTVAVGFPSDGAELRGGQPYDITWDVTDLHLHSTPITIRYARSADGEAQVLAENVPNSGSFTWMTPQDMTAHGTIEIVASDKAGNQGSHTVSDIVIDAIAPSRNILGPEISANRQIELAIRASDAGPSGLASVQLYASNDNGSTWSAGPIVTDAPFTSIAWAAPADGLYQLSLVATDQAGNANPIPSGSTEAAFTLLVDSAQPQVVLGSPIGIAEAGSTSEVAQRRIFKPGDQVQVPFTIKDPNTRPDGVTVEFQAQTDARWETIGANLPPSQPLAWSVPDLATTTARIKVIAVDAAGNVGETIATETFQIDNQVETGQVQIDL